MKCRSCKSEALPGKTRCQKHNDVHRADCRNRMLKRKTAGVCPQCGAVPEPGRLMCAACLAASRHNLREKRKSGWCIRCSLGTSAVAAGMCMRCWFRKMAADCMHLKGRAADVTSRELADLWSAQSGRCALTGDLLIPGTNASLDHIVPRSAGGPDTIANVQWVTFDVNVAKRALSAPDFIALCGRVIAYCESSRDL
jgi:hypothetical protein